jgi:predicted signal transduction protein with EAL and GGDEF domain
MSPVSIGIAVYEFPQAGTPDALVETSDRALFKAKQNGRNRIEYLSMKAALDAGASKLKPAQALWSARELS